MKFPWRERLLAEPLEFFNTFVKRPLFHSKSQYNDSTGTCSNNEIEKSTDWNLDAQLFLNMVENLKLGDSTDSSPIERENTNTCKVRLYPDPPRVPPVAIVNMQGTFLHLHCAIPDCAECFDTFSAEDMTTSKDMFRRPHETT